MHMTYTITERILPDQLTAVMRGEMAAEEMPAWLPCAFRTIDGYLRQIGVAPAGPPFARFTFLDDAVAVEAGFPVAGEVTGDGIVEPSALPGGRAAVTTHMGPYEDLSHAYRVTCDWLGDRGRHPAGPHWEVYHNDPAAEPNASRWRTDVVVPYR